MKRSEPTVAARGIIGPRRGPTSLRKELRLEARKRNAVGCSIHVGPLRGPVFALIVSVGSLRFTHGYDSSPPSG
ncbi:MAG: hypothetical protein NTX50_28365, partial [Candidatus Sumerlaeota bacterium]|nr:hypothetical protein [Candidatus Sumerlaeota bacterium]